MEIREVRKDLAENHYITDNYTLTTEAVYQPPIRLEGNAIPLHIADPHNEVLGFWKGIPQQAILHIDQHSDSSDLAMHYSDFDEQIKNTGIASFLSVAAEYGMINSIYWIDPARKDVTVYGREGTLETAITEEGRIIWWNRPDERLTYEEAWNELERMDYLLDIDLDAFACVTDDNYIPDNYREELGLELPSHYEILDVDSRLATARRFLEDLHKPTTTTIARSQTPSTWTVPELVDILQEKVIEMVDEVYSR